MQHPPSAWKQKIITFAGALGAPGLFLISFLDSSVLSFPIINDLLLIELSIQHPLRMPLYAFMAALGSVLGCVLLYFIARKGGGSPIPSKSWRTRALHPSVGGIQWFHGHAGGCTSAPAHSLQDFRIRCRCFRSSARELYFRNLSSPRHPLLRGRLPGCSLRRPGLAFSYPSQIAGRHFCSPLGPRQLPPLTLTPPPQNPNQLTPPEGLPHTPALSEVEWVGFTCGGFSSILFFPSCTF